MILWIDTETRSSIPIRRGHAAYSQDVRVIMAQWAIDNGPVTIEDLSRELPSPDLIWAAREADEVWAHEADFDRRMLATTDWWPQVPLTRWRCTAALARMHGLPGALAKLCAIFKLPLDQAKSDRGKELIKLFCIPYGEVNGAPFYHGWWDRPSEWQEFLAYGGQDVVAMREVHRQCPKWNATPRMWKAWRADELQNERGVRVDTLLAAESVKATTIAKKRLGDRTFDLTDGEIHATTQRDRLLAYMAEEGVSLPDLTADTVERRLQDESLPEHIKELLRIRQQASKASTAKYNRVLTHQVRGRLHDLIVFCGAMRTGRKAGRLFQPQNLPRPPTIRIGKQKVAKYTSQQIALMVDYLRMGAADLLGEDTFDYASCALRGTIIATQGHKLICSDLANIEGRKMAWLAGEEWKLDAFRAYDAKKGPDLYKLAYALPFNIDPYDIADEGDQRRQIGKVMELALQYYGGVGAFCSMAETYGLDLDDLAENAWPVLPKWALEAAREQLSKILADKRKRWRLYGLQEKVWLVCEALVLMWRKQHPAIVKFWYALEKAIVATICDPTHAVTVGRVAIDRFGAWLRIRMPSGRYLCYPAPRWQEFAGTSFAGVDPYTRQWRRISTYCGKVAENITQGSSADILIDGQVAAEDADYQPVLTVHDELICDPVASPRFTAEGLSAIMISNSPWASGLPLAAKGFETERYRKK